MDALEEQIAEWRALVARGDAIDGGDVEELEAHLRDQIADLDAAGLAADEAFLIAVKRMGTLDALAHEFAHEHSDRLWKQLLRPDADTGDRPESGWLAALAFAVAAAVAVQIARLAADFPDESPDWLGRNAGLLVVPFLAAFFAHRRRLPLRTWVWTALPFAALAIVVNVYPFDADSDTGLLIASHLPVLLGAVVAFPYTSGDIWPHRRRMDFVRFVGEWAVYYALIALGGGVLMALTAAVLEPTDVADPERVFEWVLPSGAAGAVIVAAWLVEWKQQIIENMAPVLAAVFTPLFALMLVVAAVVYAADLGGAFDRELLGVFDALMVVVLGLVLYGVSARGTGQSPEWMDYIQLVAIVSALILDVMVLGSMVARVGDLGFTPNRTAALGLNLVLLVNLAGTAWFATAFVTGRSTHERLVRWQMAYLPVFAAWLVAVVAILPPLFAFD